MSSANLASNSAISAPTDSQSTQGAPTQGSSISIALSGGGIRASLFSLGSLVALVQTGVNSNVTQISSVSGGSITNAAVAQSCSFTKCPDSAEFYQIANPLAKRLCGQGAFLLSLSAVAEVAKFLAPRIGGILTALIAGIIGLSYLADYVPDFNFEWPEIPWLFFAAGAVILVLVAFWSWRGWLQEALYGAILASLRHDVKKNESEGSSTSSAADGSLANLAPSQTLHVMIATDLISGAAVYFSRDFIACPYLGWGDVANTRTATAVYASAAFPIGYPPRRLRLAKLNLQNGSGTPPFARSMKLTDGGVHNNLGTGWFEETKDQQSRLWRYGNRPNIESIKPTDRQMIVNSGAASRRSRRVPSFMVPFRTMGILYNNTVKPRLDRFNLEAANNPKSAPAVIDITLSPYHLADYYARSASDDSREQGKRSADIRDKLDGGLGERYWAEFARHTSSTPTKLTKAGLETGARILWHGYLSTLVALHSLWDVELPRILGEEYFLDMAGRPSHSTRTPSVDPIHQQVKDRSASGSNIAACRIQIGYRFSRLRTLWIAVRSRQVGKVCARSKDEDRHGWIQLHLMHRRHDHGAAGVHMRPL
jgi:predicted acylesterase/phospholipase RssA